MKLFTQWRFILLSALFSLLGMGSAWAQLAELEVGGVYHFVNANYTDKAMGATNPQSVAGVAANEDNKAQLWYVESKGANGYALRNLGYGTYLQGNGQSSRWTLASTTDADNSWIKLETKNSNNTFKGYTYGNYGYAHIDGSSNIVGWETGSTSTQWTITKKGMTSAEIEEALNFFNSIPTIQKNLDDLFTDKSCTTLKSAFNENNESFKALPPTLQAMVRKVAEDSWEETNFTPSKAKWDAEYAKKYRVQLYEPYNEPECAAAALGLNAHTNLNNPTGIFANNGDVVYVMVESEIKAGSSLYLTYHIGHGELSGYANGWELHQGLNVIPVYNDETNFCINYVVHTFDTSDGKKGNKAKARKLSDYDPIKIHIEGGHINGYWNKVGDELYGEGDKNADWDYIEARATQKTVTVLGKYITLQFPLLDENTVTDDDVQRKGLASYFNELVKIEDCINEWDNVMLWERLLLGVLDENTINAEAKQSPYSDKATVFEYTGNDGEFESDYSDYYNVHGLSYGIPNSYMYGGWAHCGYNFNTMEGIIQNLPINAGSHWGPGHEIGHQHQNLLTVNGLTEVTNNLFSNVVLWYYGETTSRYNGDNGALSNVLAQFNAEGTDFFSNNIWAQTIMYYKLFLYYHVLGHNPKFYPRLFEMLRQDPMSGGYNQDGSKCLMHFYKKCCLAAGEDLTEFFRAHGFFEVMDNRFVGDYANSVYNLTQAQIDEAIAEVKSNKWKENIAVLFINDATGEKIQSHKGDDLELYGETTICSEIGSYASYATATTPSYNYAISGNTVTMEGSGGVGFAILNENGELIGFSDKKTFEISAEAAAAIASGKASVVTLKADNTPVAATNVMDTGNTEAKYELLGELLGNAKQLLDLSDETGTKVGYYRVSSLTNLQEAYESAKEVYDAQTVATYSAMYDVLYQEYANLLNNDYARINITEGYAYRLTNKAYSGRSMAVNTENNQMSGIATAESDAQLWYFEAGASPGTYYLKNKATGLYPGDVSTGAVLKADKSDKTTDNGAHAYRLQNMGNGVFALVGKTGLHCSSSQSYNIVGWGADADATLWYITANELNDALEARTKLEELIGKTEALVNEMAEVKIKGSALDLTTCTITSNTPETGHETKYLVDGNPTTFFHTNWSGAAISENHNFIIDLGEGNSLEQFAFNYITLPSTSNNVDAPKAMVIEGSTNGTDYTSITSLSGLPTTKGTTYASATLGTKGTAYRYLRFSVTDATGGKLGSYYYFGLAEFGLTNMQTELLSVKDGYSTSQTAILNACDGLYAANLVYNNETATKAELQTAASELNEDYEALLDAYNAVKEKGLDDKKKELQALINKTNALIGECGSVVNNEETTPQLNITAAPYLLTDNNGASRGSLDKLYDGLQGEANSYTSNWEATPTKPSYLQVDLGAGKEEEKLIFTFTNRNEGDAPTPTEIVVTASADGNTFTKLATYTSEEANWPPAANGQNIAATKWTSPVIEATSACRYWRFTVTKSQRSSGKETNANGIYHFGISEFGIVIPASCKVTVNEGMGGVTKELLLATYDENQEAKSAHTYATTEAQVVKAIANLQAQYDALEAAKNVVDKSGLVSLIQTATARLGECGTVTPNGDVLDVTLNESNAGSVNKDMLRELYRAIEDAQGVIANTKATQEDVNAEIAELTAQIEVVQTAKNSTAKTDLKTVIDAAQTAIDACASSITQEGGEYTIVWNFETAGDVDKATLIAAYEALAQANAVYNGDASTVSEYQAAKEALDTPIATLNAYKEGYHKSQLKSMVDLLTALIETCNTEGQGDLTTGMLEEMVQLNETATAYLTQEFATQEVLVSTIDGAISNIETNYPTWSAAQQSTAKKDLRAMIALLAELIDECGTVTEEGSEYVATLDPYAGVVTEEQLIAAYRAKVEAETLANNSAVATDLTAKKETLQTVYNELLTAKNTNWLPVTLTRDINNPVLYTFKSARSSATEDKVMQYDPSDAHSFSIVNKADGNAKQAYFFMMGDTRDQVYVYPYAAARMVIAADETDNAANKVFASEKGTRKYEQWTFVEQGDWYNLQPVGTSTYLSHFNGGSNKMGFYSSDPDTDYGSRFQFEEVEIEGSSAYNSLKVYYDEVAKVQSSEIVGGDGVGYYPVTEANAYNTAYATATEVLNESSTVTYDHYWTLRKANEDLILNMPKAGKYYKIVSVSDKGYCNTALAYANENNGAQFSKDMTSTNARAVWEFIPSGDGFHVRNLHTDSHIGTLGWGAAHTLQEETAVVKIEAVNGQGLVKLINGQPMHAQETNSVIVGYPGNLGSASIWSIQEVDIDDVTYPLTITQFGYAGLHLNYPVELPDGLTAYTIYSAEGANGIARMRPISGSVIPANTGVIIEGKQGNYDLNYQVYEGEELDNLLSGSNYTRYVKADDNTDYFVFAAKKQTDGSYKVGLYITWEEFDATGSTDIKDDKGNVLKPNGNKNSHDGGYFKSSANKIFLPCSNEAGAAKFFFQRDSDITDIDSLLNGLNSDDEVYDLQGRRISKVTKEGIYIVNGQKRYLKATKF